MLTHRELYLFDTTGFLVVKGLLAFEEVERLKHAISDAPSAACDFANTTRSENLVDHDPGIAKLAADPRFTHRVQLVINQPMRVIESYSLKRTGPSVLYMHNGFSEEMEYEHIVARRNMGIHHTYHDGRLYCMYVKALCYLTDVSEFADGPFCYVQGSHKANFPLLAPLVENGEYTPLVDSGFPTLTPVFVEAGDVLFLNEALLHGTFRKTNDKERAFVAFSYAPTFVSNYKELNRSDGDIYGTGHYEFAEEDIAVAAGHGI